LPIGNANETPLDIANIRIKLQCQKKARMKKLLSQSPSALNGQRLQPIYKRLPFWLIFLLQRSTF